MPRQMWRKFLALFVLLFPLFLFVAQAKTLLLDDADDNSHICLYVGDTLTIKLPSNRTTGYSWGQPESGAHLELLSTKQEQAATDRVGAPGFQVFSFKATETGVSTLTLNYFRPFEKDTPPVKTFLVSLTIEARPFVAQNAAGTP